MRALLREQHPDLAALPLLRVAAGWDNEIYRLGDSLAVRLPRRESAVRLLLHEQRWLPGLAASLPLPIPVPVRVGIPAARYHAPWSIVPWLEGETADVQAPGEDQAGVLAAFLRALHVAAPAQTPTNPYRDVPLRERSGLVSARMADRERLLRLSPCVSELWAAALAAPLDALPTWIHGDLHARNVLVSGRRLVGILDWGDLCVGDRATDLAAIWFLFDSMHGRHAAMAAVEASEATWARARGWAVLLALILAGVEDSRHVLIGERTLRHLEEGP